MKRPFKYSPVILLQILGICGSVYALQGSTAENGSNAAAVHQLGITGKGVNVCLLGGRNVRDTHQAFNDSNGVHVFNFDYSGSGVDYTGGSVPGHDTWVAGIIASRGWAGHPNDIGVAPDCNIYSARVASTVDIREAFDELIVNRNCKIVVTAFQFGPNDIYPDGNDYWTRMYDYYADACDVVFANAAGNDYSMIAAFGDAYNGITTAALIDEPNDFYLRVGTKSNPGPTVDGRRKPEISCPGSSQTTPSIGSDTSYYTTVKDGATSFAIPQTAGVAALLLEYANSTTNADDGHSEVIKAVIVNSTFPNIKDKNGNATNPTAWHTQRGYGRIDALRAYETLSTGRIIKGATATAMLGWAYDSISFHQTHTYQFAGKKNERFIFTVTWNRVIKADYTFDLSKSKLKVTVKNPSGGVIYSETDDVNNLEKRDFVLPVNGNYAVLLYNPGLGNHDYGLAFERLPPLVGDFNIDYAVDGNDLSQIISDWLDTGKDTNIAPDPDGRTNWPDFAEFADNWLKVDWRYYKWP